MPAVAGESGTCRDQARHSGGMSFNPFAGRRRHAAYCARNIVQPAQRDVRFTPDYAGAGAVTWASMARSAAAVTGLIRCSLKPAARRLRRSASMP